MEDEIYSKQQILKYFKINRKTFESWRKKYGLPVIEVSPNKKYIRKSDLIEWEESRMGG